MITQVKFKKKNLTGKYTRDITVAADYKSVKLYHILNTELSLKHVE